MNDSMRAYGRDDRGAFERLAERAIAYLQSRSVEHWLMFMAGLVLGLLIG